jgi:hypothetical protein
MQFVLAFLFENSYHLQLSLKMGLTLFVKVLKEFQGAEVLHILFEYGDVLPPKVLQAFYFCEIPPFELPGTSNPLNLCDDVQADLVTLKGELNKLNIVNGTPHYESFGERSHAGELLELVKLLVEPFIH